MQALNDKETRSWVIRRIVYLVGAVAGLVVVALGRGSIDDVESWAPTIEQIIGMITAITNGIAAAKTGPDSDNRRPVVPAEHLVEVVDRIVDGAERGVIGPAGPMGPQGPAGSMPDLDEVADRVVDRLQQANPPVTDALRQLRERIQRH